MKYRDRPGTGVFLRLLVLIFFGVGIVGCDIAEKQTKILVPAEAYSFIEKLLRTDTIEDDSDGRSVEVISYDTGGPLESLPDDADIIVTWWSKAVTDSHKSGVISSLPSDVITDEKVWSPALLDFLSAASQPSAGLIGLPLSVDPWIMMWNRDRLSAGGDALRLWENITGSDGPVFGLAGSAQDARLAWVAFLADAYPSVGGTSALNPWRNGLKHFAQAQADGIFQRAAFSYPWSDALTILTRGDVRAVFAPLSRYRSLDGGTQTELEVRRPPDARGRSNYPLFADVLLAVVRTKSSEKAGVVGALQALAEAGAQRELADLLGTIPARIDAPVRDGASFTAVRIARTAAYVVPRPSAALVPDVTYELADLSLLLLRNPTLTEELLAEHGL